MFQHGGDRESRNGREAYLKKPEGVKRIAVIGDSLTFGDGVKAIDTYPSKLRNKLKKGYGNRFQVINYGIMGINTDQQAWLLTKKNPYFQNPVLSLDPDIVIHQFCVNDIELMPDPKPRPGTLFVPQAYHDYIRQKSRLYRFLHMEGNQILTFLGFQKSYAEYLQNIYRSDSNEWREFNRYLNYIINSVRKNEKKMLLVIFPSLEMLDKSHPFLDLYSDVEKIGRQHHIEVLNLYPYFEGKNASSLRVSLLNGHPNEKAHEIASEAIYDRLVSKGFLSK